MPCSKATPKRQGSGYLPVRMAQRLSIRLIFARSTQAAMPDTAKYERHGCWKAGSEKRKVCSCSLSYGELRWGPIYSRRIPRLQCETQRIKLASLKFQPVSGFFCIRLVQERKFFMKNTLSQTSLNTRERFPRGLPVLASLVLALALGACSKSDETQTAGQKLDSAIAKTEQAAEEAKIRTEQSAAQAKAKTEETFCQGRSCTEKHDAKCRDIRQGRGQQSHRKDGRHGDHNGYFSGTGQGPGAQCLQNQCGHQRRCGDAEWVGAYQEARVKGLVRSPKPLTASSRSITSWLSRPADRRAAAAAMNESTGWMRKRFRQSPVFDSFAPMSRP